MGGPLRGPGRGGAAGEEDVAALAGSLKQRQAARGGVLFRQKEPQAGVWVLRRGTVELTVANGRRPLVVQVLHPGDVDGDIALLLGGASQPSGGSADR